MRIDKVQEGLYTVESFACPTCGETTKEPLTGAEVYAFNQGARIVGILASKNVSAGTRERYMTGYCDPCWIELFGTSDEDE